MSNSDFPAWSRNEGSVGKPPYSYYVNRQFNSMENASSWNTITWKQKWYLRRGVVIIISYRCGGVLKAALDPMWTACDSVKFKLCFDDHGRVSTKYFLNQLRHFYKIVILLLLVLFICHFGTVLGPTGTRLQRMFLLFLCKLAILIWKSNNSLKNVLSVSDLEEKCRLNMQYLISKYLM